MNRSKLPLLAALVLAQFTLAPLALARGPGHGHGGPGRGGRGGGMFPSSVMEKLNLTAEQKQKIRSLREESGKDGKGEREAMKKSHEEFRSKMAGTASDDELKSDFAKMQERRSEMAKKHFEKMLKVRTVLTVEQRQQFSKLIEERRKNHRGHGPAEDHEE